jgi:hypothetical protein
VIKTHTCYTAPCDVCGREPGDYDYSDAGAALDAASYQDWWTSDELSSDLVLCDGRDDAHLAKAREIAGTLTAEQLSTFQGFWPELFDENDQLLPAAVEAGA